LGEQSDPQLLTHGGEQGVQKYLGVWNCDQPNLATLNNVAVL
jgi:hypothetical protein